MTNDLEITDSRVEFIALYLLKSLKLKNDKWIKLYTSEDNKVIIEDFLDKTLHNNLVFSLTMAGHIMVSVNYPTQVKTKSCYFSKRNPNLAVPKDGNLNDALSYGDLSYNPMQQLSTILNEVNLYLISD